MENTIRIERAKINISQKKLAEAIGTTQANINKIEKCNSDPKLCTAFKIADFFKLNIGDLFNLKKND